jgi:DNA repair protein RecN (Recombination protein N)
VSIEFDPKELNDTEERLFALRAAARKYQVTCDALPEKAAVLAEQLGGAWMQALIAVRRWMQAVKEAQARYDGLANELSHARHRCAEHLARLSRRNLPDLKLGQARFMADVTTDQDERGPTVLIAWPFRCRPTPARGPAR